MRVSGGFGVLFMGIVLRFERRWDGVVWCAWWLRVERFVLLACLLAFGGALEWVETDVGGASGYRHQ